MNNAVKSFVHFIRLNPLRALLSILTVTIGVLVVILSFDISIRLDRILKRSVPETGSIVVIANAEMTAEGSIERVVPAQFDQSAIDALRLEYPELRYVTPIVTVQWPRIVVDGTIFQTRSVAGVSSSYRDLYGLEMLAGSFFTEDDVTNGRRSLVISEEAAVTVFGGAEAAIGKTLTQTAQNTGQIAAVAGAQGGAAARRMQTLRQEPYTVVGVFRDQERLRREAYGIADFVIPYTAMLPSGLPSAFGGRATAAFMNTFVGRVSYDAPTVVEARVRSILEREYGGAVTVMAWEGNPAAPDTYLQETRSMLSRLTATVRSIGIIVLVAATISIFSIMLVESLNKNKEIGLRRAMGATRFDIARYVIGQAVLITAAGSVAAAVLSVPFNSVFVAAIAPYLSSAGIANVDLGSAMPGAAAVFGAVGLAVLFGVVFGLFPAIPAGRVTIIEQIREE
ncbi:MAG: FtsX-like permease family protein [Spirochaetaceae bacterium]|nr:MAG: FtsX-like permease family protein [Spirochaetaceae bacterium]